MKRFARTGFEKVRNHFGVTRLSQVAALAALQDQDWMNHVVREVKAARIRIAEIATANGLKPLLSATNFVTIDCGRDGTHAKAIVEGLLQHTTVLIVLCVVICWWAYAKVVENV